MVVDKKGKIKLLKEMTKKELIDEYLGYDQLINDIGCFGTKDVIYFYQLEGEILKRGYKIKTMVE